MSQVASSANLDQLSDVNVSPIPWKTTEERKAELPTLQEEEKKEEAADQAAEVQIKEDEKDTKKAS